MFCEKRFHLSLLIGVFVDRLPAELKARLRIVHLDEVRPYRPLPLFRADTIVQHYMQPEEFKEFHARAREAAGEGAGKAAEEAEREERIAAVYDLFVQAKVMRR